MSQQVKSYRVSDLTIAKDPKKEVLAAETIDFTVDSKDYEIDLSEEEARDFRKVMRPYVEAARVRRTGRRPHRRGRPAASSASPAVIRDWARQQGFDVKDLGRVPADIVAKYQQATAAA